MKRIEHRAYDAYANAVRRKAGYKMVDWEDLSEGTQESWEAIVEAIGMESGDRAAKLASAWQRASDLEMTYEKRWEEEPPHRQAAWKAAVDAVVDAPVCKRCGEETPYVKSDPYEEGFCYACSLAEKERTRSCNACGKESHHAVRDPDWLCYGCSPAGQ